MPSTHLSIFVLFQTLSVITFTLPHSDLVAKSECHRLPSHTDLAPTMQWRVGLASQIGVTYMYHPLSDCAEAGSICCIFTLARKSFRSMPIPLAGIRLSNVNRKLNSTWVVSWRIFSVQNYAVKIMLCQAYCNDWIKSNIIVKLATYFASCWWVMGSSSQ